MPFRATLVLAVLTLQQSATQPNTWEQDLKTRRQALVDQNGPGTDSNLRDQLFAMMKTDQEARGLITAAGTANSASQASRVTTLAETDRQLTAQLKQIAESKGWPTIRLVGLEASNAAMLILTHTADHDWQRTLLPQLEQLADNNRIDGSALALVVDKELLASGQLQRYGSQFKEVKGSIAMFAVEDPANLDRRRAQLLLPPMDVYRQTLSDMYHLKVSNQIVTPTPPQKP